MRLDVPVESSIGRQVVGAGLLALDVIVPESADAALRVQAGGTCGNVLAALAYLGWTAYPISRLGDDGPASRICRDLAAWKVRLDFVLQDAADSTPVIAQHIRGTMGGAVAHSFSWRCPACGADLPRYRPLRLTDIQDLIPRLPAAGAFFFDRVSAAIARLAHHYRERGALVVFEPSGVGDPRLFREAIACAHVVKYSHQRLEESTVLADTQGPKLLIETRGDEGLRFRALLPNVKMKRWLSVPAIPAARVRDTAGCGDWCTAGLIHRLAVEGSRTLLQAGEGQVSDAIRFGQALAAWNCGFEGARGGMYESTWRAFEDAITALVAGNQQGASGERQRCIDRSRAESFACGACPRNPAKSPHAD